MSYRNIDRHSDYVIFTGSLSAYKPTDVAHLFRTNDFSLI